MAERIERVHISEDSWLEVANVVTGVFSPLTGFMTHRDYESVIRDMHTGNGEPWTMPITLEIPESRRSAVAQASRLQLCSADDRVVGELDVEDVFRVDYEQELPKLFGTSDPKHHGLRKEASRSPWRVGGRVRLVMDREKRFRDYDLTPEETKKAFRERKWRTVVGFQTRNAPHRAHEHLQRVALEIGDGLLIHPLIGWKSGGEFTPQAIVAAYETMISRYYPRDRVQMATLRTPMRYAGPREAVFHAIIRRNFGCTHFIVGRDHAGVGGYYGKYEAQQLCEQFTDLGIVVLALGGPDHCRRCQMMVTERSCGCGEEYAQQISGTEIRACFQQARTPPPEMMRPEVAQTLEDLRSRGRLFTDTLEAVECPLG